MAVCSADGTPVTVMVNEAGSVAGGDALAVGCAPLGVGCTALPVGNCEGTAEAVERPEAVVQAEAESDTESKPLTVGVAAEEALAAVPEGSVDGRGEKELLVVAGGLVEKLGEADPPSDTVAALEPRALAEATALLRALEDRLGELEAVRLPAALRDCAADLLEEALVRGEAEREGD